MADTPGSEAPLSVVWWAQVLGLFPLVGPVRAHLAAVASLVVRAILRAWDWFRGMLSGDLDETGQLDPLHHRCKYRR